MEWFWRWLFSAWPYSMCGWGDYSYSESLCCLTHPTIVILNRIYGMEEMLFKEQTMRVKFLTIVDFESNDFIYLSLHIAWCLPSSFYSRENMCWKKFFEKFQEGCLLHDHLWYLSGIKEAFQSLFFYLIHPIKFLPMRTYGLEEDFVWRISRCLFSG